MPFPVKRHHFLGSRICAASGFSCPWGGVISSDTHLERLEVVEITLKAVEHLAHRHALDSVLGLDQDHLVSPYGERRDGKTVA